MVELVDTGDLKSPDLNSRAGSSPAPGTTNSKAFIQINQNKSPQYSSGSRRIVDKKRHDYEEFKALFESLPLLKKAEFLNFVIRLVGDDSPQDKDRVSDLAASILISYQRAEDQVISVSS